MAAVYLANIFGNAAKNKPGAPEDRGREPDASPLIIITETGDLTVQAFMKSEYGHRYKNAMGYDVAGKLLASFKVDRLTLRRSSAKFHTMLDPDGIFPEAKASIIDLEYEHVKALELWFRHLHGCLVNDSFKIPIVELRAIIDCSQKQGFPLDKLNVWFEKWMINNGGEEFSRFSLANLRDLLFPCQEFNHAKAFAVATMKLAYDTPGHVHEEPPTKFPELHLEPRIITSINAARGSLKMKIHEYLYINREFLNASCRCRKDGLFEYETALDRTGVWPLEEVLHGKDAISLQDVLDGLVRFQYHPPNGHCHLCASDLTTTTVAAAIKNCTNNFDGLCLDCIDKPRRRDWDADHYKHRGYKSKNIRFDKGCRFPHGEPTWWFSWIARRQDGVAKEPEHTSKKRKADEMEADDE
ncbi:uncharacterized protein PAC_06942 [Phialocephala subalpina]|uniref:Uncharacterized protein n=1 Tax=Phialocephala subalpina TaxID=576137 RepID=A0A1L7WWC3_9HELO|nr:uncharacterized protein PAC_06942 [Phialocephala subalpina]